MNARTVWFLAVIVGAVILTRPLLAAPDRPNLAAMAAPEITALQRQLTDARCYAGPLDGQTSPALQKALATCPDPRPSLRIETGTHVSPIRRVAADPQCRLLVTGSDDKTVRLWSMPEGRLIRTQRLPIGKGTNGNVYAVAVSPDGSLIAAGGWDAAAEVAGKGSVYLFDTATGTAVRHLGAFESIIGHLAFSPDGKRLAVAVYAVGVRVLDVASGREIMADRDFGGKGVYGVAFGPDNVLYAVGYDGSLRRYGPDLALGGRIRTAGGNEPYVVVPDPAGRRLAIGYNDTATIDFYDARDLHRLDVAETPRGIGRGGFSALAWSRDGKWLFAGGSYRQLDGFHVRILSDEGRRVRSDLAVSTNTLSSLVPCGSGVAFGSSEPSFGLIDSNERKIVIPPRPGIGFNSPGRPVGEFVRIGKAATLGRARTMEMRGKLGDAFTVSPDGTRVRFGLGFAATTPVLFDLAKATLSDSPAVPPDFLRPDTTGVPVTGWQNTPEPRIADVPVKLRPHEMPLSLAVRPDRSGVAIGTEFALRAYDAKGNEHWHIDLPGAVWGSNLARGGDLMLAAAGDGTIRWHRWSDGKELLALFVDRESRAWVAWTPSGYYAASAGGEDMIGWQVNRGWEQPADFFPASKFRDQFARPDIVERVLDTLDEAEAVRQANAARIGKPSESAPITERLPPVVTILSPSEGSTVEGDNVRIEYSVRSPSGLPVDAVEALIDGRPPSGARGLGRDNADQQAVRDCLTGTRGLGRSSEGGLQGCRGSLSLRLPPGTSEIGLFARTGGRAGDMAKLRLTRSAAASREELAKPRLFALVVGISAYANPDYRLAFAAKDAGDFTAALQNQKDGLYGDVTVLALADGKATAAAIREGLDWLTKHVSSRDVGLVYLAGHGVLDDRERFYFLPADGDADRLRATAVPREDIQDALDGLPGKALLFLDACHSGAVAAKRGRGLNINAVANEFANSERGVVAFTASTGRQLSQENPAWGNGAFTKAVTEALGMAGVKAKGDLLGTGQITTSALDLYVSNRVKGLTNGEQSPIMVRPPTVPDFALAVVR